jgi:hypothetical protein
MTDYLVVTCPECGEGVPIGRYNQPCRKGAEWARPGTTKCANPECNEEFSYSAEDVRVESGPDDVQL